MKSLTIVKLGGSIITDKKDGKPIVHTLLVKRLASEMRGAGPLLVLYGGGSFGHPLARKFRLPGRELSPGAMRGFALTTRAMWRLGGKLAKILAKEGLPTRHLQTSALVREEKGNLIFSDVQILRAALKSGATLLLGGDVVIADGVRIEIASADRLAATLAKLLKSKRIIFATDVDGVFKHFPPRKGEEPIPKLTRTTLRNLSVSRVGKRGDVTGAMGGKLAAISSLRDVEVTVCNGTKAGVLGAALQGDSVGTRILL